MGMFHLKYTHNYWLFIYIKMIYAMQSIYGSVYRLLLRGANAELGSIWAVGQHMWKRDFPSIYKALNAVTWSDSVAEIMKILQDKVRSRAIDLIQQAYSSITLDMVVGMTGLPKEIVATACVERGWSVETDTHIIHPIRCNVQSSGDTSSEDQLYKLTEFVSFLEN
ncbi:hypothetical protein FQA39_LY12006 [Lamprigera yunnana]|nr:hypothetical protein FQA39_LY12006 [Lamprigera yunnana]